MGSLFKFLTIFQGSIKNKKKKFKIKKTRVVVEVIKILISENYFLGVKDNCGDGMLLVFLKLRARSALPMITNVSILSTTSRSLYINAFQLKYFQKELVILSTTKGIMTHFNARRLGLGGKLLFKVSY